MASYCDSTYPFFDCLNPSRCNRDTKLEAYEIIVFNHNAHLSSDDLLAVIQSNKATIIAFYKCMHMFARSFFNYLTLVGDVIDSTTI